MAPNVGHRLFKLNALWGLITVVEDVFFFSWWICDGGDDPSRRLGGLP